ncbi:MAG TPA: AI-2E family transporter [Kofleriaceae bacterium]|nr:AI-2E family transporter [Kofleriaceae bacterium]
MASEQPVPRFFLVLMAAASALLVFLIYPMASELLLAAVLAGLLWPLRRWLTRRLRGRVGLASGILTVGVIVLVLGPLAALVTFVIRDGSDGIRFVSNAVHSPDVAALVDHLPETARDAVTNAIAHLPRDLGEMVEKADVKGSEAAAAVGAAVAATGSVVFSAALMVIALFFLLANGPELVRWLDSVSPLRRGQTLELLDTFKKVSIAVIVSTAITAAVQAAAALVGYLIAQVPNPIFFAAVTFFVALIPAIGAAAVCLVAGLLLFVTGHPYMAIFLAVWGVVVVGLVDNLVKPLLIRRGMELHGAVVFFALIGGLAAFGAIGLVVGPIVVALFLALLRMYHRDFTPGEHRVPQVPGMRAEMSPGTRDEATPAAAGKDGGKPPA